MLHDDNRRTHRWARPWVQRSVKHAQQFVLCGTLASGCCIGPDEFEQMRQRYNHYGGNRYAGHIASYGPACGTPRSVFSAGRALAKIAQDHEFKTATTKRMLVQSRPVVSSR